jgi:hypothetical protein
MLFSFGTHLKPLSTTAARSPLAGNIHKTARPTSKPKSGNQTQNNRNQNTADKFAEKTLVDCLNKHGISLLAIAKKVECLEAMTGGLQKTVVKVSKQGQSTDFKRLTLQKLQHNVDLINLRSLLDATREELACIAGFPDYSAMIRKGKHKKEAIIELIMSGEPEKLFPGINIESIRRAADLVVGPSEFRRFYTAAEHGELLGAEERKESVGSIKDDAIRNDFLFLIQLSSELFSLRVKEPIANSN